MFFQVRGIRHAKINVSIQLRRICQQKNLTNLRNVLTFLQLILRNGSSMELNELYSEIVRLRRRDLQKQKMLLPPENIAQMAAAYDRQHRDVQSALVSNLARQGDCAERKSLGLIQKIAPNEQLSAPEQFDFLQLARNFEQKKYAAVAVNCEKHFFGGAPSMLSGVTHLINLPIIRWDFVIDAYEIMQSKLWGADAVRVNVALLENEDLTAIAAAAAEYQLEIVAGVNSVDTLDRALQLPSPAAIYWESCADCELFAELITQIPEHIPVIVQEDGESVDCLNKLRIDALITKK